jgi:histidyl-tRNA synthetase
LYTGRPRGTEDVVGPEVRQWQYLEALARELSQRYGYEEIRTPVFEHTELFVRSAGETSDVVTKEMYTFLDRGGRSLTLRPEGTAAVVRAFLENRLYSRPLPVKLFYLGPMFRYSRPQAGRLRQFHQFGAELLGSADPAADAEVISLAMDFFLRLGLERLELHLNSIGCPNCRPAYREALVGYLGGVRESLCPDCLARYERNPLRVFDCKENQCRRALAQAPLVTEHLCRECADHYAMVKRLLEGLGIPYQEDPYLVRGLDYYTKTAFEIMLKDLGAQNSLGGGGRYDGLVEAFGGPSTPAVGFAVGLERVLLAWRSQGGEAPFPEEPKVFVAVADHAGKIEAVKLVHRLRQAGLTADISYQGKSLKSQMKHADRWGAQVTVILGGEELAEGTVTLRRMSAGVQERVPIGKAIEAVKRIIEA